MDTKKISYFIVGCVCFLRVQLCVADIIGKLIFPSFSFFKGETEVILKNVKTGEIVTKTVADKEGRFSLSASAKPLYSIVAKTKTKDGEFPKFVGEYALLGFHRSFALIKMIKNKDAITLKGRITLPDGLPMKDCLLSVDCAPCDEAYINMFPIRAVFTDSKGFWKIENVVCPKKYAVEAYVKNPRLVAQPPYFEEPLIAVVYVHGGSCSFKKILYKVCIPLITENMRKKLGDAVKNTTLSLPVSTNNVIYVGDIVLPDKKQQSKD